MGFMKRDKKRGKGKKGCEFLENIYFSTSIEDLSVNKNKIIKIKEYTTPLTNHPTP